MIAFSGTDPDLEGTSGIDTALVSFAILVLMVNSGPHGKSEPGVQRAGR